MLFSHFSGISVRACSILACIINLLSSWVYCSTLLWVQFIWLYCFCYLQCSYYDVLRSSGFSFHGCSFRGLCSALFILYCFTFLWLQFSWLLVFSYSTVICWVYAMPFLPMLCLHCPWLYFSRIPLYWWRSSSPVPDYGMSTLSPRSLVTRHSMGRFPYYRCLGDESLPFIYSYTLWKCD